MSRTKETARRSALRTVLIALVALLLVLATAAFLLKPSKPSPEQIAAAVRRDPALIEKAWQLPAAAQYRRGFEFQSNGSVCGPASVANVLRSLAKPASESSVLAGSGVCTGGFCWMGLTLDELADVARKHTTDKVTILRDLTVEAFKQELLRSNYPKHRYVINFNRAPIFKAGGGHHSPLAGYLEAEDLAFVLDVNRDYQPWLIPSKQLYAAMNTFDGNKTRGLLRFEPKPSR